ncbi:hypothetical protein HMPREF1049_1365 [Fusobacterium necrophorum subsp. funduliforme ATCC 51357]|nr:hypothetical protein [Fusobacterium necrophorum]EIJ70654.1 hypothetical protein HMPREF1049_1365 [Fusobacterium necrophorum subsp. funduliforme ATCC 51357]
MIFTVFILGVGVGFILGVSMNIGEIEEPITPNTPRPEAPKPVPKP